MWAGKGRGKAFPLFSGVLAYDERTLHDPTSCCVVSRGGLLRPAGGICRGAGKPIPHDNESLGQIVIRGPWVMEKYFKNPEKTSDVWYDGWFHTGDMAKIDE